MTSTLDAESTKAKNAARVALDTKGDELIDEEADIAESRVRFEAERLVNFYDELGDRQVSSMLHPYASTEVDSALLKRLQRK